MFVKNDPSFHHGRIIEGSSHTHHWKIQQTVTREGTLASGPTMVGYSSRRKTRRSVEEGVSDAGDLKPSPAIMISVRSNASGSRSS